MLGLLCVCVGGGVFSLFFFRKNFRTEFSSSVKTVTGILTRVALRVMFLVMLFLQYRYWSPSP